MEAHNNSRVYIVHSDPNSPKDFGPAKEFGSLIICVNKPLKADDLELAESHLRRKMEGITANDWIIPTGNPALIALAGHIMGLRTKKVRVLMWDWVNRKYYQYESAP